MIEFTINGNQENERGNPLPKARKTYRQQHTDAAVRYHEYLDYVRGCFFRFLKDTGKLTRQEAFDLSHVSYIDRKPLVTGYRKCRMVIKITWGSHAHGDPENIFGAIADAIFEQDKYLSGEFDFDREIDTTNGGRVEVKIFIGDAGCGVHTRKGIALEK